MSKPESCPVCHRTNDRAADGWKMCGECTSCLLEVGPTPGEVAVWVAQRVWRFAGAEVDAAIGAVRNVSRLGDPGLSRNTGRRRRR